MGWGAVPTAGDTDTTNILLPAGALDASDVVSISGGRITLGTTIFDTDEADIASNNLGDFTAGNGAASSAFATSGGVLAITADASAKSITARTAANLLRLNVPAGSGFDFFGRVRLANAGGTDDGGGLVAYADGSTTVYTLAMLQNSATPKLLGKANTGSAVTPSITVTNWHWIWAHVTDRGGAVYYSTSTAMPTAIGATLATQWVHAGDISTTINTPLIDVGIGVHAATTNGTVSVECDAFGVYNPMTRVDNV